MSCNFSNDNNVGSRTNVTCNCANNSNTLATADISPLFTCPPKKEVCCSGIKVPCFNRCSTKTVLNYVDSVFDIKKGEATAIAVDFEIPLTGRGAQEANLISNFVASSSCCCTREFIPSPSARFIVESASAKLLSIAPCRPFDNDDIEINCKPLTTGQSIRTITPNFVQIDLGEFAPQVNFNSCPNGANASIKVKPFKVGFTIRYTICGTVIDHNCHYKFFIQFDDTKECHKEKREDLREFIGEQNFPMGPQDSPLFNQDGLDLPLEFLNNELDSNFQPSSDDCRKHDDCKKHDEHKKHEERCDKISSFIKAICIPRRASIFSPFINLVYNYSVDLFDCIDIEFRGKRSFGSDDQFGSDGCHPNFGEFKIKGTSIITPSVFAESVQPIRAISLVNPVEDSTFTNL